MAKSRKWPTYKEKDRISEMFRSLNDRQILVLETVHKKFRTEKALEFLKENGYSVTDRTLRRDKKVIKENALPRLYQFAKIGFETQHVDRIDKLDLIEKEMWLKYEQITDPYKQVLVLEKIANLQPIISAYHDTTRYVLETSSQKPDTSISQS